jgi:outer membrane protein TolC
MIPLPYLAVALSLVVAQAPKATPPAAPAPQQPAAPAPAPAQQAPAAPAPAPQPPAAQPGPQQRAEQAIMAPPAPTGRPLTLDEALKLADERNQDLKSAAARLKQAEQGYWKAWAGYLPQVTVGGTYTHYKKDEEIFFPSGIDHPVTGTPGVSPEGQNLTFFPIPIIKQNQWQGTFDAQQMLFSPQLWFAIQGASRGSDSAREATENVRRQILFGTANAFYGVATLRELAQINDRLLEIAQRQEKDARVRYQAGTIAKVGLLRAEISRASAEQDVLRSRNSYQSARLALAQLIDSPPDFDVVTPEEPRLPPDTSKLLDTALRDRSDVRSARSALGAAQSGVSAQVGSYFPNLVAAYHYQKANFASFTPADFATIGLALQWKLFDGGLREANFREANAKVAEADANLASTELTAKKEVGQALLDLESARANALKAKEQRDLAAENQRLVDVSYRAGAATAVEQADATAQLRNAEFTQLAEGLNAQVAALRVLQTSGGTLR